MKAIHLLSLAKARQALLAPVLPLLCILAISAALAHGPGYTLDWWTVDSGGGTISGDGYTLVGTAGQPDAAAALVGGGYLLSGGVWGGAASDTGPRRVYLPVVLREHPF